MSVEWLLAAAAGLAIGASLRGGNHEGRMRRKYAEDHMEYDDEPFIAAWRYPRWQGAVGLSLQEAKAAYTAIKAAHAAAELRDPGGDDTIVLPRADERGLKPRDPDFGFGDLDPDTHNYQS